MILIKIFHLLIGGAALISCASGRSAQRTDIPRKVNKGVYKTITKDTPKVSKHHLETKQRAADGRHPTGGNGNDFIILLKNSNPKNDIRNIMIVNTRDSVKLNHKSSALTRKQKSIDITTKPVTKRTTVKNATETVRYESPAMLRAKDTISTKPGALPNADILDMAPATGSRIIAKRLKGRLCHRHVLLPEGPKYDSSGRMYMPAHSGQRRFAHTSRPRLLLPSCCNCCRKSVLGCE